MPKRQTERSYLNIDYTPSVWLLVAGLPLALFLLWRGRKHRRKPGGLPFLVLIGLSTAWTIESILELLSATLSTKLLWADLQYLSICFVPVAWLALTLDYTGNRKWLTRRNLSLLCVVPLIMLGLQWTNSHHGLMRASVWLDASGGHPVIGRTFGPVFWVLVAYSYFLILAALAILLHFVLSRPRLYRKQPAALLIGFSVPYVWNAVYLLKPGLLPQFDYTPALFAVGQLIVAYSLFRLQIFDLVSVARDTILENMADGLLVLDHSGKVMDLNESARSIIGRPAEQILGVPVAQSWTDWGQVAEPLKSETGTAMLTLMPNGVRRDYELTISDLGGSPEVRGRVLIMHDVTERSFLEESLRQQALMDGLTGLANRTLFMSKLGDAIHLSRRHPRKLFAVMVLDIDRFKFINDTIGHPAGDAVLETVAVRLRRCVREPDMVARLGGDEFLVLLSDIGDMRDVVVVSERIQDEMRAPIYARQQQMIVSASVGIVLWDATYRDAEDLLHAADAAMYQAKGAGGACYRIFDERMHHTMLESMQAEVDLREAVDKGDFELAYQPVVDLKSGKILSLEALVRWKHPLKGMIAPRAFLGAAETSGLIVPLGEMILDQLCDQLSRWRSRTSPAFDLPVRLNVSPRQLIDTDFVGAILSRIADWSLSPGALVFEVTEAALNRDPVRARNAIKGLCTLGMPVCLDDFGNGPSSLHHLTTFPGQEIKLDCALVNGIAEGTAELAVAKAITELAHALQLTVTGEGVESERDWEMLGQLDCDHAQGFYCGEPMAPPVLLDYLRERRTAIGGVAVFRTPGSEPLGAD
jgi:diguanylate cyclase (GGDEF)-like protein/PAS domain S-box-containing protein